MKTTFPIRQFLSKSLTVAVLSACGGFLGWSQTPSQPIPHLSWGSAAQAQESFNYSEDNIRNYARAALALESRRHEVANEIKKIVGDVPRIICDQPTSFRALPGNAPQLAVSYCDQAKQIIESKGLTVSLFNDMTRSQQSDPRFRQRIQAEILQLLQSGGK
ncbi:DUF4168 domain-containing protein [Planktothrix sp. FACHB-1365]|uniref:DUF4168 domain-containing protein n=1 Tax=Planktothrix sp. FACHB-1365 TaxID=2692855 RepID=UPI00168657BB|nr:DUF4168 domain-containing protein [Planktothrix sp. FACHB-1365]MBD2484512.1 DUF4168 domain-containing protein [Planktothrix sp. FACHB-1365]